MNPAIKLRVAGIEKSFPGVKALDKVHLAVRKGTVHAICGENGAGKSTLMKVIMGVCQPDAGRILVDEHAVRIRNPMDARRHGIAMIFQELDCIPEMTVEESFFVGCWPRNRLGGVDWSHIRARAAALLKDEHLPYSPETKLNELAVSDIQMLEIVKAVSYNSAVIIMDEPTSALSASEVDLLFAKIDELRHRDKAIIYISHKLDEVFRIADEITVLRDGCVMDSRPKDQYDADALIGQMVGRRLERRPPPDARGRGGEALRVEGLTRAGRFQDVSFHVRQGEIIGFAGLVGAGRTDVMRALFGLDPADGGEIRVKGERVAIRSPGDAIRRGLVMLSEDRRRYGIVPVRSVRENVSLSNLRRFIYGGRLHEDVELRTVGDICRKMNVKAASLDASAGTLSGGNQQKILLARWMINEPEVLLVDEPTRGIDVGAKQEIYGLMRAMAQENKALVVVSSEWPELLENCDRIYVMAKGRITAMVSREDATQEMLIAYATGAKCQPEVNS